MPIRSRRSLAAATLGFVLLSAQPGQSQDALNFFKNYFITGDYEVAGVGLAGLGVDGIAQGIFAKTARMVNLKGEAFFQVQPQIGSTFVITANDLEISVLGTSFNVQAYEHSKAIEVVVQTGTVELADETNQESITLHALEKGIYRKANKQLTREPNKDINFLSWKTRKITFVQDDLNTVVQTLNRTYQVNIYFSTHIPPTCELTVTFDNQTLDAVLNVLKNTLDLSYQIDGDQIEITGAGC